MTEEKRSRTFLWIVIGGGAIVVKELANVLEQRAGIDELIVSEHDILDGIALSIG